MLETADNVVQAYTLPKPLHVVDSSSSNDLHSLQKQDDAVSDVEAIDVSHMEDIDVEETKEETALLDAEQKQPTLIPKTMQQLAEANAQTLAMASAEATNQDLLATADTSQSVQNSLLMKRGEKMPSVGHSRSMRSRKRARSASSPEDISSDEPPHRSRLKAGKSPGHVAPARTLRPRVPKSDAKKKQERELELAYRRAIEE